MELTYGQRAVGLSFNPGNNSAVHEMKLRFAGIIDELDLLRGSAREPEAIRLLSIAITEAQSAQMWAVKAITWN